ncbi:putative AAA domain-containing protein [Lasiodiplodia theobromae]|uniref:Putative AAA domain-containing protein n=1 Tax=Lasiodiplodia theobromae TaxID=45133 RepID=A0A5N5DAD0_9PEZI|nr:putative AAA domain-containing protein [Lasiodiplodia theobromae]
MRGSRSKLENFDPNASDPDDSDFEENPSSPPRRPSKKKKSTPARKRTSKRARHDYGSSDDDIVDDDDEISEESYASANDLESEEEPEVNASGRPARNAAKKNIKYEESADEDIEDNDLVVESTERNTGDKRKQKKSRIVVLKVDLQKLPQQNTRSTRARSTRAASKSVQPESNVRTRRSVRLSEDREEPLQELGYSGRARSVGSIAGSHSPQRRAGARPAQGRKAPMKRPSTIMEASQEASGQSAQSPDPLQPKEEAEEEVQVSQAASITSEIRYEGQDIEDAQSGEAVIQESEHEQHDEEDEDEDDEGPVTRTRNRTQQVGVNSSPLAGKQLPKAATAALQQFKKRKAPSATAKEAKSIKPKRDTFDIPKHQRISQRELKGLGLTQIQQTNAARASQRRNADDSSDDFDPGDDDKHGESEDDDLDSERPPSKRQKSSGDESTTRRKSQRLKSSQRSRNNSVSDEELDVDEIRDEVQELRHDERRNRQTRPNRASLADEASIKRSLRRKDPNKNYTMMTLPDLYRMDEENGEDAGAPAPSQGKKAAVAGWRPLYSLAGPFGGLGGKEPLLGMMALQLPLEADLTITTGVPKNHDYLGEVGDLDSDSSDDNDINQSGQRGPRGSGNAPKSVAGSILQLGQTPDKGFRGGPAGLGKIGEGGNADVNPITVDEEVNFDSVGGLDNHINQLKEMVTLPLLYPEMFQKFKITPPRGVLFHGPPGTGKTLLARALSNALSTDGKKVTFYMRKGADALSKWVGEAERQLRMLFEDARRNQPSIIFFDEIDGLAPVRSSKSEQSLASIVATLLALMDGMDDRGQVVIIGATNRPDNVDPALRRPGRFDREFYFPLPDHEARRSIISIHTKNWSPPLSEDFKNQLAEMTKGYGGADLRALCTEAAVNAIQGTFPQVYKSNKKLLLDVDSIQVSAKDFMISVNKIVPSSQRSTSFGAAPLKKATAPLLKPALEEIARIIDDLIPPKKKLTALEEAQYDDRDDFGFERENIKLDFEQVRVFRPRLLIRGFEGMGQQEIGSALLHRFDNMHVQSFDLSNLLGDRDKSAEATLVQLFKEVRTHKPSVIYIPQVDVWYETVGPNVVSIFTSLLRTMPANEPVLVLGTMEQHEDEKIDPQMLKDLFGYSLKNQYELKRPNEQARKEYFQNVVDYIRKPPKEFPDVNRRKRKFEELQEAPKPSDAPKPLTKADLKAIKKRDRYTLQLLKLRFHPIMEQLKNKYRRFKDGLIPEKDFEYLWREEDPRILTSDVPVEQRPDEYRPYEFGYDSRGVRGLVETATGNFYYNLGFDQIERRIANGYYKRPIDFLEDVKYIAKDTRTMGKTDLIVKADEILTNVEVDTMAIELNSPDLVRACQDVYKREQERFKALEEEERKRAAEENRPAQRIYANVPPPQDNETHVAASDNTGPIILDESDPTPGQVPPITPSYHVGPSSLSNGLSTSDQTDSHKRQSNGSGAHGEDSSHLEDSQEQDSQHRDKRQKLDDDTQQSAPNTQTATRSQKSGHTQMAPNTQPGDYRNSASTTTSGQKTSDRSSAHFTNTQSTVNGVAPGQHPDFASGPAQSGGSQIPDTQEPFASSQLSNSQQSQQSQSSQSNLYGGGLMPPARQEPKIGSLLNSSSSNEQHQQQAEPQLILDEAHLARFHDELVHRSSGLSVEQLEQVNAAMMAAVWRDRGEWNRIRVIDCASTAFNETIRDIEEIQKVWPPSQDKQNKA